ncbi:hypothetical protein [Thermodesulfovibrio sp. TK110]
MKKKFYPDYLIEILFFAIITFEIILVLAFLFPPVIGRKIDFTAAYQPRPEWYYLWLFYLLRFFSTDTVFIGGFLVPFILVIFLLCIPWLDKKFGWTFTAIIGLIFLFLFVVTTIIEALS